MDLNDIGTMKWKPAQVIFNEIEDKCVIALDEAESKGRLVNWNNLREYMMEEFLLAPYRAEEIINKARKRTKYKLAFGSSIQNEP